MSNIECPYCYADNDVCHDDDEGFQEGVKHEMQCSTCNHNFTFETAVTVNYYPEKADCLNGSPHDLYTSRTYGDTQWLRCKNCEHTLWNPPL